MSTRKKTFEFGDFRFVPSENLLTRCDQPVSLPPKALGVLELLVSNAGHVVEKDILLQEIWDGVSVEESTVARTIWLLRQALTDDPKRPAYIQTVPKRGYRFVADVVEGDFSETGMVLQSDRWTRSQEPRLPRDHPRKLFITAGLGLVLIALVVVFVFNSSSGADAAVGADHGTKNDEAYRLYLQGMYAFEKRNPENARKAVELFDQAIQLDPAYARAWAGKGRALRYAAVMEGAENMADEYQRSKAAIDRAISLDPALSEGYLALCENNLAYEYDIKGAEQNCLRALELRPDLPAAYEMYSRVLSVLGRHSEAITVMKTAIDLEPSSLFYQRNYGVALFQSRRYDEAVVQLKRVIEMDNSFDSTFPWLYSALQMQGRYQEAFELFMKSISEKGNNEEFETLDTLYRESGWEAFLKQQIKLQPSKRKAFFPDACQNARAGNIDRAIELLEKAFARREWGIAFLDIDPRLDSLRDDPRFKSLISRSGIRP